LLRPEDLEILAAPNGLGVITHRSFFGSTTRLQVGVGGVTVKVDVRSSAAEVFDIGERVDVLVSARDVLVTERRPAP
jgi:ABC-type Fe3+/spermidine/putrescine transport system ATPase subunit